MAIGSALKRSEDARLLTGRARFVADVRVPGMVEAYVLRSPYAHARILDLDTAVAVRRPDVVAVLTFRDLPQDLRPIPVRLSASPNLVKALQYPLAKDRVRYVGEPVALVIADSRYAAEDAAELIRVEYEELPVVSQAATTGKPAILHETLPDNLVYQRRARYGEDATFAAAPHRLSMTFHIQRHTGSPMECRGLVAAPGDDGRLHIYGPTKVVHFNRQVLADLLGCPVEHVHSIETDVGGGFGVRGEFYPEDYLIPYAAENLRRPVRWVEDRLEHLKAANHSREQVHRASIAFDDSGRVLGLKDDILVDTGAYIRTHGVTVPDLTQAMLPGPYQWPALDIDLKVAFSNKTPTGTYRGPGRFEGGFVRERLMDAMAYTLGGEPSELRLKNLIPPEAFPYSNHITAMGQEVLYDGGDYAQALLRARALMDWEHFESRRQAALGEGKRLGFGWAAFVEKSGTGPSETARVVLEHEGGVCCYIGLAALGQGTETIIAQICADRLGIAPEQVHVVHGDTDLVPEGHGSWGSRGTAVGGAAAYRAADKLATKLKGVAARLLEADPSDIVLDGNGASVAGVPELGIRYRELASLAERHGLALEATVTHLAEHMTYPYGTHAAEVEVDPETGALRIARYGVVLDVGRAVNPLLLSGQIAGGMAQGLGGTLFEQLSYDQHGQLLSGTFMDYLLPGAMEVPDVMVCISEDAPSPHNPLGAKGGGEGGTVGVAPAVANALADALGAPPQAFTRLPILPETIRHWAKVAREVKR